MPSQGAIAVGNDRAGAIAKLAALVPKLTGINFALMMREGDEYFLYPRNDQPCQGGEMRKYQKTHPNECTQPHNAKPGDLYHPFPDGEPCAVGFNKSAYFSYNNESRRLLEFMYGDKSPWLKGFGSAENVLLLDTGLIVGVNHLDVDPTVLVNSSQAFNSLAGYAGNWIKLVDTYKLSEVEALAIMVMNNGNITYLYQTGNYYFPARFSARRFFEQAPNDLSGGLYSARTDYNRTYVQDLFLADVEDNGITWHTAMKQETGLVPYSIIKEEDFVKAATKVLREGLEKEGPLTNKPYQYRNASGKVLPTPVFDLPEIQKAA